MRKKAMLLASETLKIVIAVICIGFLVYFLFSLYNTSRRSEELEQAESSLSFLIDEINSGATEVEIYNPTSLVNKWEIISWPSNIEEGIPNSCSNFGWENCICICKKINPNNCDESGVCRESEFSIDEGKIVIKNPPVRLMINSEQKMVSKYGT